MNVCHRHTEPEPAGNVERGYILIFVALLLIPMFAAVGFSTDVGSWYVRASQLQRASDAASLAGVVWLPDMAAATTAAEAAARQNGFDPADPRYDIIVERVGIAALKATITDNDADLFFSKIVIDQVDITRSGTSQYIRPIPIGSPDNTFGNQNHCDLGGCAPGFWLAISAPYTMKANGDPYATRCTTIPGSGTGNRCSSNNSDHRDDGYWYAVEVTQDVLDANGGSVPINVEVFDGGFYNRSPADRSTPDDHSYENGITGPSTLFKLYNQDSTPLDFRNNPDFGVGNCEIRYAPQTGTDQNTWNRICRMVVTQPGVFPLNVRVDALPFGMATPTGNATNQYSLRAFAECGACGAGTQPTLYALNDFGIYINVRGGGTTEFFLAKIDENAAGKEVTIEFFDPGDGNAGGTYTLQVLDPRTGLPWNRCSWTSTNGNSATVSPCSIVTRNGGTSQFNGHWLNVSIDVPNDYVCAGIGVQPCWWKINYDFPPLAQPTDRLVISVSVSGDPIKLIE